MTTIWERILKEDQDMLDIYNQRKLEALNKKRNINLPSKYFEREIYPQLIPALTATINIAAKKCSFKRQRCLFNSIDCLSELLYNRNPKYPERAENWTPAYYLFFNPETVSRPVYPLSWILSQSEAALIIQKTLRGYNIRKLRKVQEMKEFWKAIKKEGWFLDMSHIPTDRCKKRDPPEIRWY